MYLTIPHAAIHAKVAAQLIRVIVMYPEGREYLYFTEFIDLLIDSLSEEAQRAEILFQHHQQQHNQQQYHPAHQVMNNCLLAPGSNQLLAIEGGNNICNNKTPSSGGAASNGNNSNTNSPPQTKVLTHRDQQFHTSLIDTSIMMELGLAENEMGSPMFQYHQGFYSHDNAKEEKDNKMLANRGGVEQSRIESSATGGTSSTIESTKAKFMGLFRDKKKDRGGNDSEDSSSRIYKMKSTPGKGGPELSRLAPHSTLGGGIQGGGGGTVVPLGMSATNPFDESRNMASIQFPNGPNGGMSTGGRDNMSSLPMGSLTQNPSGGYYPPGSLRPQGTQVGSSMTSGLSSPNTGGMAIDEDGDTLFAPKFRPFSHYSVTNKLCREYITFFGILSETPYGLTILLKYGFFDLIAPFGACREYDYLTRLFLTQLNFTNIITTTTTSTGNNGNNQQQLQLQHQQQSNTNFYGGTTIPIQNSQNQNQQQQQLQQQQQDMALLMQQQQQHTTTLLDYWVLHGSTFLRRTIVSLLRSIARQNIEQYKYIGLDLTIALLYSPDPQVSLNALGLLEEVAYMDPNGCLEVIIQKLPTNLKHFGNFSTPLYYSYLQKLKGFQILLNNGWLLEQLKLWRYKGCREYVENSEYILSLALSTHLDVSLEEDEAEISIKKPNNNNSTNNSSTSGLTGNKDDLQQQAFTPPHLSPYLGGTPTLLPLINPKTSIWSQYTLHQPQLWSTRMPIYHDHDEYMRKRMFQIPWKIELTIETSQRRNIYLLVDTFVMEGFADGGSPVINDIINANPYFAKHYDLLNLVTQENINNYNLYENDLLQRVTNMKDLMNSTSNISSNGTSSNGTGNNNNNNIGNGGSDYNGGYGSTGGSTQQQTTNNNINYNLLNTINKPKPLLHENELEGASCMWVVGLCLDIEGRPCPIEIDQHATLLTRLSPYILSTDAMSIGASSVKQGVFDNSNQFSNFVNNDLTKIFTKNYLQTNFDPFANAGGINNNTTTANTNNLSISNNKQQELQQQQQQQQLQQQTNSNNNNVLLNYIPLSNQVHKCHPGDRQYHLLPSLYSNDNSNELYSDNSTIINRNNWTSYTKFNTIKSSSSLNNNNKQEIIGNLPSEYEPAQILGNVYDLGTVSPYLVSSNPVLNMQNNINNNNNNGNNKQGNNNNTSKPPVPTPTSSKPRAVPSRAAPSPNGSNLLTNNNSTGSCNQQQQQQDINPEDEETDIMESMEYPANKAVLTIPSSTLCYNQALVIDIDQTSVVKSQPLQNNTNFNNNNNNNNKGYAPFVVLEVDEASDEDAPPPPPPPLSRNNSRDTPPPPPPPPLSPVNGNINGNRIINQQYINELDEKSQNFFSLSDDFEQLHDYSQYTSLEVKIPQYSTTSFYYLDGDLRWNFYRDPQRPDKLYLTSVWYKLAPTHDVLPSVSIVPHLYGEISKTIAGCGLLYNTNTLHSLTNALVQDDKVSTNNNNNNDDDRFNNNNNNNNMKKDSSSTTTLTSTTKQFLYRRVALWGLAHIGATEYGIKLLIRHGIVSYFTKQATFSKILSFRGTCFYLLGLLTLTATGREHLNVLGWDSTEEDGQITSLGVALPRDMLSFLHVPSTPLSRSYALQPMLVNTPLQVSSSHSLANISPQTTTVQSNNPTIASASRASISYQSSTALGNLSKPPMTTPSTTPSTALQPSLFGTTTTTAPNGNVTIDLEDEIWKVYTTGVEYVPKTQSNTNPQGGNNQANVNKDKSDEDFTNPHTILKHCEDELYGVPNQAAIDFILGHISNLCNIVSQRTSLMMLRQLKMEYPKVFASPILYAKVCQLLQMHTFALPARRFVIFELFGKVFSTEMNFKNDLDNYMAVLVDQIKPTLTLTKEQIQSMNDESTTKP